MPPNLETPPQDLIVGIGELKESKNPQGVIVTYALGSCLGVTCYDPLTRVGGMLHAMLGDSKAGHQSAPVRATYLDTGIPDLIQRVIDLGGNPRNFPVQDFRRRPDDPGERLFQHRHQKHQNDGSPRDSAPACKSRSGRWAGTRTAPSGFTSRMVA
jgi:hypothetical protein